MKVTHPVLFESVPMLCVKLHLITHDFSYIEFFFLTPAKTNFCPTKDSFDQLL